MEETEKWKKNQFVNAAVSIIKTRACQCLRSVGSKNVCAPSCQRSFDQNVSMYSTSSRFGRFGENKDEVESVYRRTRVRDHGRRQICLENCPHMSARAPLLPTKRERKRREKRRPAALSRPSSSASSSFSYILCTDAPIFVSSDTKVLEKLVQSFRTQRDGQSKERDLGDEKFFETSKLCHANEPQVNASLSKGVTDLRILISSVQHRRALTYSRSLSLSHRLS